MAEDNVVNQRVAQKMLNKVGIDADIVFDGGAAIEAANRESDVVAQKTLLEEIPTYFLRIL